MPFRPPPRRPDRPPRSRRGAPAVAALAAAVVLVVVAAVALAAATAAAAPGSAAAPLPPRPADIERPGLRSFEAGRSGRAAFSAGALGRAAAGSARYDLLRYDLELAIDPATTSIEGRAELVLASVVPALSEVVLDLGEGLRVDSVTTRLNVEVAPELQWVRLAHEHAGDSLSVFLPVSLAAGDSVALRVHYGGHPPVVDGDMGLIFGTHHQGAGPLVASNCEPAYSRYWRPCKDRPDDKSTARVAVTVPADLIAVSNGTLVEERDNPDGTRTFVWYERYPIAAYLLSVAISDYVLLGEQCLTDMGTAVPLRHWVFAQDEADAAIEFAPTCDMVSFLEGTPAAPLLGPYPFAPEKYGHAAFDWGGAMEHQTVTSIGYSILTGLGTAELIVLHELAHQWLGDAVTPAGWADIWLNEGFATYCEALWREHTRGREGYLAYMDYARDGRDWAGRSPVYDPYPVFPGAVIYDKGAWILHMLRGRIGDEAFFALLHDWATDPAHLYGNVTTQEFVAAASAAGGEDLGPFFWPYLTTDEVPLIALEKEVLDGGHRLRVRLSQAQLTLFDNVYPLRVTMADDRVDTVRAHLRRRDQTFEWTFDGMIGLVDLDPEQWVLWRPAAAPPEDASLVAVFPNPASPRAEGDLMIGYSLSEAAPAVLRVVDARGRQLVERRLDLPAARGSVPFWDGRDGSGRLVPAGVYWIEMEARGQSSVRKVTVLR